MRTITIKFSNRFLYTFIAVVILIIVGVGVYAYNNAPYNDPAVMGHTMNELSPADTCTSGQILKKTGSGVIGGWICDDAGGDGEIYWTQSGTTGILYDEGSVGIGGAPTAYDKLYVNGRVYAENSQGDKGYLAPNNVGVSGVSRNGNEGWLGTQTEGVYGKGTTGVYGENVATGSYGKLGISNEGVSGWGNRIGVSGINKKYTTVKGFLGYVNADSNPTLMAGVYGNGEEYGGAYGGDQFYGAGYFKGNVMIEDGYLLLDMRNSIPFDCGPPFNNNVGAMYYSTEGLGGLRVCTSSGWRYLQTSLSPPTGY